EAEITIAHLTPAMGQLLAADEDSAPLPKLRLAAFGGDVLRASDVAKLRALAPHARALNFYGATETPQAMGFFSLSGDIHGAAPVPLGRGIDGVDLLVLNSVGIQAGIGELGEIVVRTPYLSAGYRNDPALSGERFVPNPSTGDPADRMYRTGDLGRYRLDGAVEPAGRADRQVKVRGFRVEPGEVEGALVKHAAVREAVVDTRGEGDSKRLVAWLTGARERPKPAALREHLRGLVPEYMVPAAFVWLDALPLTPNGKLERRALPDPQAAPAVAPVSPRTPTEELVAEVWREVLGVGTIGVEDDFFALGGSWTAALTAAARVAHALEVELPAETVFTAPTVAATAALVEAAGGGALADALAGLDELSEEELAALLAEIGDEA
ncbi:MAG TPA: AMP-binding protein, partial [Longimicrobium sp.]|nr:AMP-binding protein [Longimicrobium sp.]